MDIRQLKYFLAIKEEGGVTAAARVLHMSQPPLSNQLRLLEEELGVTLFERVNKRLVLTKDGEIFYESAKILVRNFEQMLSNFNQSADRPNWELKIGCVCSLAMLFFPKMMKGFQKKNPQVKLLMYEYNSIDLLNLLKQGTIELGIIKNDFDRSDYDSICVDSLTNAESDYLSAVGLPEAFDDDAHYISFKDLNAKPLLIQRTHEDIISSFSAQYGFFPNVISTHENVGTSIVWSMYGLGIALMPNSATKLVNLIQGSEKLEIKRIINPQIDSHTNLIWKKDSVLSHTALQFIDYISDVIAEQTIHNKQ